MKRWWTVETLQIGGWIGLLVLMLAGGYYRLYLAGWQEYTLFFALAVLVLSVLPGRSGDGETCHVCRLDEEGCSDGDGHHHAHEKESLPTVVETALHFTPLFLFAVMGPTTLTGNAGTMGSPVEAVSGPVRGGDTSLSGLKRTPDGYIEATLLDLYVKRGFREKALPVKVTGMLYVLRKSDEASLPFGVDPDEVRTLLVRYAIWCCVADARRVSVVIKGQGLEKFKPGQWLEVKGKAVPPKGSLPLFVIRADEVRPVERPENPYIF